MAQATTLRFEWVTDRASFSELREDWNSLSACTIDTIFLTYDWLANWLEQFAPDAELHVLTAWDAETLVAVLPLFADRTLARGRHWAFMGTGTLTPNHLDLIVDPNVRARVLPGLVDQLLAKSTEWDLLDLDKVPADSATSSAFASAFRTAGLSVACTRSAVCFVCDLPPTFDEYVLARSKSTRKSIKATSSWLRKRAPEIRLGRAETLESALHALDCLERFHQARWESRGYPGAFADERVTRFHEAQVRAAFEAGSLRMYTMTDGEDVVAVSYNFLVGCTAQAYLTSFDERLAKSSPGVLLRAFAIEQLISEGACQFDWLEGAEEYKKAWCTEERNDLRLRVYNRTLAGRIARTRHATYDTTVSLARRWVSPALRERVVKTLTHLRTSR